MDKFDTKLLGVGANEELGCESLGRQGARA